MLARTEISIAAAAVVIGLAAWDHARVETPRVRIVSPVPGTVAELYVGVDSDVKTGQPLAWIDSPELRARLATTRQDLEMERSAQIHAENTAEDVDTDAKVQLARADVARCEQAVEDAEAALNQQRILSPIDGKVLTIKALPGKTVRDEILLEMAPKGAM